MTHFSSLLLPLYFNNFLADKVINKAEIFKLG